jgi:hypothetical protein
MPYQVGGKGTSGCSGFPVVDDKGKVMGCHPTKSKAGRQVRALYASGAAKKQLGDAINLLEKDMVAEGDFVLTVSEDETYVGIVQYVMQEGTFGVPGSEYSKEASKENPVVLIRTLEYDEEDGWEESEYLIGSMSSDVTKIPALQLEANEGMDKSMHAEDEDTMDKEYKGCGCATCKEMNVDCPDCPVCSMGKSECCPEDISKQAPCWEGYVQRGMKPGKNGKPVPNCVPAAKADDLYEDDDDVVYETDSISKAEGYSPPAGARSAARKAIKFKEDGKANGAGTAVGWTRAGQLARGETISLSTVKRMYSYFSRHEVDKKGKDWGNNANPSNGYIMWLAWGGDAGFAWSRSIVNRETDKMIFGDFGKEITPIVRSNNIRIFNQPEN